MSGTTSGGLKSSVLGGGLTPAAALLKSPFHGDEFLSARGGETCVRQGTTEFSATLTPSLSSTNLLSGLERKLADHERKIADQDAKRRQLEERLKATQGLLEKSSEKLGEAWKAKDDAVYRLEAKAFNDLAAQRRAADEVRDAQRTAFAG